MESGIKSLIIISLSFSFLLALISIDKNQTLKQSSFEANRAAVQNGLFDIQNKYENFEIITEEEMLENWINNFLNNSTTPYDELDIRFLEINTEPAFYLVYVEGYLDEGALIDHKTYVEYLSGAMIIEE